MTISMAQLGRDAARVITRVTGRKHEPIHWVNKTEKYVSIKMEITHLTADQINIASAALDALHPDRFIKITNGTAHPGSCWPPCDKVMVRFTQT